MHPYFNEKLIRPVFRIVAEVLQEHKHADKCLQQFFQKQKQLKNNDKAFVAELCYELIRNWRLLTESASVSTDEALRHPFSFLPAYYYFNKQELPESLKIRFDKTGFLKRLETNRTTRKLRESYPNELDQLCASELGEEKWNALAEALNKKPSLYLRVNTIKIRTDELRAIFESKHIKHTQIQSSDTLLYKGSFSPFSLDEFKNGLFEVQDIASQSVAGFMDIKEGERIIDCCAGNGGKSLHIATLLQNKGKVVALDIYEHKLEQLKKRAARAGIHNIETRMISREVIRKLTASADKILIDTPCSGTGVFKRNPDAKWNLKPEAIRDLHQLQRELLATYSAFCRKGGVMVYANCSILPSEGEKQIEWFLETNKDWKLTEEKRLHPDREDCDGFYMAKLLKIS